MRVLRRSSIVLGLALLQACDGSVTDTGHPTALALDIVTVAGSTADQGRLQIEGTTRRTVTLNPGETRQIELPAGSYTVSLEGLTGGTVTEYFERSNVTVTEGQLTTVTAVTRAFAGATPTVASTGTAGTPLSVSWAPVTGAGSYDLQASTSQNFASILDSRNVSGTSAEVTLSQTGTVFFRVRPVTRFSGAGTFGSASAGTLLRERVASVDVAPDDVELEIASTVTLQAIARSSTGQQLTGRTTTWESTNEAAATVNQSGQVTAVAVGETTIRATVEGVTGVAVVRVVDAGIFSVEVLPAQSTIDFGGTVDLTATARTQSGSVVGDATFTWRSEDESIAIVDANGRVTGTGGGTTTIIARADDSGGVEGGAQVTVDAGPPPLVVDYDVFFLPVVSGCVADFRDFRTMMRLDYFDADGNMDPGRTFTEPLGGPFAAIQSQYREEGASEWKQVAYERTWSPSGGATGGSGGLQSNQTTCWGFETEPTFMDYRVRVRDAKGNWSAWLEVRLNLPQSVVITPADQFSINAGSSIQFSAEARDGNDVPVVGDPVNWSSYVGAPHATISPSGLYQVSPSTPGGLDWIIARAGYARAFVPGAAAYQAGSFVSPQWSDQGPDFGTGGTRYHPVRVFAGRQYVFRTTEDPNSASDGDVDLYIAFGQQPTTTTFDFRSWEDGLIEEIVYTAPADGTLWMLFHGFDNPVGWRFSVEGEVAPPPEVESLGAPGARRAGGRAGPPADVVPDLLLPPRVDGGADGQPGPVRASGGGLVP